MRKIVCLILTIVTCCFSITFSSCREEEKELEPVQFQREYDINELGYLKDILTVEYDLAELQSMFKRTYPADLFGRTEPLHYHEVNEKFPVEAVRPGADRVYSVYSVAQGGYYYVFWMTVVDDETLIYQETTAENIAEQDPEVWFAAYISAPRQRSDFSSIRARRSTSADILKIDPYAEFSPGMSSGIFSQSLLDDQYMLEVRYREPLAGVDGYDELIVEKIELNPRDGRGWWCYNEILPEDLPASFFD